MLIFFGYCNFLIRYLLLCFIHDACKLNLVNSLFVLAEYLPMFGADNSLFTKTLQILVHVWLGFFLLRRLLYKVESSWWISTLYLLVFHKILFKYAILFLAWGLWLSFYFIGPLKFWVRHLLVFVGISYYIQSSLKILCIIYACTIFTNWIHHKFIFWILYF